MKNEKIKGYVIQVIKSCLVTLNVFQYFETNISGIPSVGHNFYDFSFCIEILFIICLLYNFCLQIERKKLKWLFSVIF